MAKVNNQQRKETIQKEIAVKKEKTPNRSEKKNEQEINGKVVTENEFQGTTDGADRRDKPPKPRRTSWSEIARDESSSIKLSWADEADLMEEVTNAGFKLEYVSPMTKEEAARLWAKHGKNKISILKNGIVLVRFDTELGKNEEEENTSQVEKEIRGSPKEKEVQEMVIQGREAGKEATISMTETNMKTNITTHGKQKERIQNKWVTLINSRRPQQKQPNQQEKQANAFQVLEESGPSIQVQEGNVRKRGGIIIPNTGNG
ncbi:uncharacterized protein [Nicotiana tomentosiformis]|uniref:uncharacterized protein n=1 Tax=Nicotiana tomentosiformis TaxID=4098 RepID=UPI00388CAF35